MIAKIHNHSYSHPVVSGRRMGPFCWTVSWRRPPDISSSSFDVRWCASTRTFCGGVSQFPPVCCSLHSATYKMREENYQNVNKSCQKMKMLAGPQPSLNSSHQWTFSKAGQTSRSQVQHYGTLWKVLSQEIHMCNMKALSSLVWKL